MQQSSNDFYIKGEYFQNKPTWDAEDSKWKAGIIYDLYKKNSLAPRKIVEVGCGAGAILEELSNKDNGLFLEGYDISPQAITLAKNKESENLRFYNEDYINHDYEKADLLLTIDVIEHIDNYYNFLRRLYNKSNFFIFHVPLDLSCRTILKSHVLLQQRQSVGHIHYFSEEMIRWSLSDIGFKIIDWHYTKPINDMQPGHSLKKKMKNFFRNISFAINKPLSVKLWGSYSMLILAKPSESV